MWKISCVARKNMTGILQIANEKKFFLIGYPFEFYMILIMF